MLRLGSTVLAILIVGFALVLFAGPQESQQDTKPMEAAADENLETATFAGGCFWCMEPPFDEIDGVISTTSGFTDGDTPNPTYKQVAYGMTTHTEAVEIKFDPSKVSYEELLEVFWININPTDAGGQFCDRGSQYRTGIFYHSEEQRKAAEASLEKLKESNRLSKPIVTPVKAATPFYAAEEYHQDYYKKNPVHYKMYRMGCGRDRVLKNLWGTS